MLRKEIIKKRNKEHETYDLINLARYQKSGKKENLYNDQIKKVRFRYKFYNSLLKMGDEEKNDGM